MRGNNYPTFNKEKLSRIISDVLAEKNLTHREFAQLANLPSSSTVSTLIQGFYEGTPALKTLVAIATNVLNREVGEFISYLYDETEADNYSQSAVPVSLMEIGIMEINELKDLGRIAAALSERLKQIGS